MSDPEARDLIRRIYFRVMSHIKALGETPAFGFVSFGNLIAIEQVAEIKDQFPVRDMVAGVVFSGMNLEADEVILITKYKLPL